MAKAVHVRYAHCGKINGLKTKEWWQRLDTAVEAKGSDSNTKENLSSETENFPFTLYLFKKIKMFLILGHKNV